jgi:hypothetical protein
MVDRIAGTGVMLQRFLEGGVIGFHDLLKHKPASLFLRNVSTTSQKMAFFIVTNTKTSNPTYVSPVQLDELQIFVGPYFSFLWNSEEQLEFSNSR